MPPSGSPVVQFTESEIVAALRGRDEQAFAQVVARYHPALVRLARVYTRDAALAEEVAQETWVAVLRGIDRFEQRSTFKTWLFGILVNLARSAFRGERRRAGGASIAEAAVPADRFRDADDAWAGHWRTPPSAWRDDPEELVLRGELRRKLEQAIDALPDRQREVVLLRDVEGLPGGDVARVLGLSEANQRVLLHRGRSRVRAALESYLTEGSGR